MLQLVYFPVPGRAEASRVALALSGLEWEDVEVDGARFEIMKNNGELPWGMLPVLQTPDGTIAESTAILRFVGHKAGLIPTDQYQCAKADEFIDGMEPLGRVLDSTFGISDIDERIQRRKALFEPQGVGTKNLLLLEQKIAQSETGWAASTGDMSIADLKLFTELFGLFSGNYDGIEADVISDYPRLLEYHEKVSTDVRIRAHYANVKPDDIRWTFLPGAFENSN
jgi:glutathione S-transferase